MNQLNNEQQKARLKWIKLYEEIKDAGVVCRRCGISRPTLRKWLKRYAEKGLASLEEYSRKPSHSPARKVFFQQETLILNLRRDRKLGVRRIQSELKRHHELSLSLSTIHKVLKQPQVPYLQYKRAYRKQVKRYNCKLPGQRVQMDVCKIAGGHYQYTAIDDCTRYKVLALYKRRTAQNTLDFLENQVFYRLPFSIQRIQTDRGKEFMAYEVQEKLMEWGIKFRPVNSASPYLNGKVERSQRTDLDEFYSSIDIKDPQQEYLARIESQLLIHKLVIIQHKARFGEIESRGTALTLKGENLLNTLLKENTFQTKFPKSHKELFLQGLAYYTFCLATPNIFIKNDHGQINLMALVLQGQIELIPQTYNDFLATSAAGIFTSNLTSGGIFTSNLTSGSQNLLTTTPMPLTTNKKFLEMAMERNICDRHIFHQKEQLESANKILQQLKMVLINSPQNNQIKSHYIISSKQNSSGRFSGSAFIFNELTTDYRINFSCK